MLPSPKTETCISPLNPKAEQSRELKILCFMDTSAQFLFAESQLLVALICDACMAMAAGPNPAAIAVAPTKTVATRIDFLMCSPFLFLPQDADCRKATSTLPRSRIAGASRAHRHCYHSRYLWSFARCL